MGMIVFIAALGFVLFLDPAFQQQRQAFANAARPLKDHAEVLEAFLQVHSDGDSDHNQQHKDHNFQ